MRNKLFTFHLKGEKLFLQYGIIFSDLCNFFYRSVTMHTMLIPVDGLRCWYWAVPLAALDQHYQQDIT